MILLCGLLCGAGVVWALGGRFSRLANVRLVHRWLIFVSLVVQLVLFTSLHSVLPSAGIAPLHAATYVLLIVFTALNARRSGFWLLSFGLCANAVAILANGGRMPVTLGAWTASGHRAIDLTRVGTDSNNVLSGPHTHLPWLGDQFAIPAGIPFATAISVGDLLIIFGMTLFMYRASIDQSVPNAGSTFAPLRVGAYRHVLVARLASSLGDWMAMTAVVTWVFQHTHSTLDVSAFLIARILASIAGGATSAPLLDRLQGFRVLAWVEMGRGAVTAATIPLAVAGQTLAVILLVCVSSFLGAATSPSARALIPDILPRELLGQGNALHGVARNITMVAGTLAAAVSVIHLGIAASLTIDFASFVIAALLYLRFRGLSDGLPGGADVSRREIGRAILKSRSLFGLVGSFTIVTAAMGILNATLPHYLAHLGQPNSYGYAMATIGGGLLCGELLTGFIRRDLVTYRTIPIAFLLTGALLYLLSRSTLAETAFLLLFLLGAADGTTEITYDTILQTHTSAGQRAGTFALASAIQNAGMIVGLAVAATLQSHALGVPLLAAAVAVMLGVPLTVATLAFRRRAVCDPPAASIAESLPEGEAVSPTAASDYALAVASLLERVAETANVHVYNLEYRPDGTYKCNVWVGAAISSLLGGLPEGMDPEEAWEVCVHPDDREPYDAAVARQMAGEATDVHYRMVGFDGRERWIWERCQPAVRSDGRIVIDGIATDVTDQKRLEHELRETRDQLAYLAQHDALTGLPNRRCFNGHLARAVAAAGGESSFGVLYVDLNGFKQLNDRYGHSAGDTVLATLGARLRDRLAPALVARVGGDEFVVVTPMSPSPGMAAAETRIIASRIHAAIRQPIPIAEEARSLVLSASVGTAVHPNDGETADQLLRVADARMYGGKPGAAAA
jgi:diguanylate cyclase (GGDEF)-like protein